MIVAIVNIKGSISNLKEAQLAQAIERTVKYLAETEFTEWTTEVISLVKETPRG